MERFLVIFATVAVAGILRGLFVRPTRSDAPDTPDAAPPPSASPVLSLPPVLQSRRLWIIAGLVVAASAGLWATRYETLGCIPPGGCMLRNRWTGETVIAVPGRRVP